MALLFTYWFWIQLLFPIADTIHTNGIRPVKIPEPPRSMSLRFLRISQLKPILGDTLSLALGMSSVAIPLNVLDLAASSENSTLWLFLRAGYVGISNLRPAVSLKLSAMFSSSCT